VAFHTSCVNLVPSQVNVLSLSYYPYKQSALTLFTSQDHLIRSHYMNFYAIVELT